jgi:hypothetical protein
MNSLWPSVSLCLCGFLMREGTLKQKKTTEAQRHRDSQRTTKLGTFTKMAQQIR